MASLKMISARMIVIMLTTTSLVIIKTLQSNPCAGIVKPVAPPCQTCNRCDHGHWVCDPVECQNDQCVDGYFTETNKCCMTCPNGENCKFLDVIIPKNKTISVGGGICACMESEDGTGALVAKCI
ncbi:von Willebrand factor C domain-containing protein 2 [Biomphalaria pfeifferi]|uniref:von Willebrand factor C domain-containing protein 2 n=1 Tax=Biomphalaria pfeifferi TaxID=112525 RepID=A0AAD8BUU2_BIOPF|nr:von Willebrand factor C domain-containing protein 2 [Biomphalaria pfeifferi]